MGFLKSAPMIAVLAAGLVAAALAPPVSITAKDLTPRFLTFYRAASKPGVDEAERYRLWKADYGFAAVPPTPEGQAIARKLLDAAWPKYPAALPRIEKGAAGVEPSPKATLERVAALLKPDKPVDLTLVVYVGGFEGNAFTMGQNGKPTVAIPVEETPEQRAPTMTHEFVHAVQIAMGTNAGGWERSIGETVLAEGLAMRATQHLFPDRPETRFVQSPGEPGWLKEAGAKRRQILEDIRAAADKSDSDDVMRFTMGVGPSGLDREAYYAGWVVTEYWLTHGRSFADIARIPEAQAPAEVRKAIDAMLK